MTDRELLEAAAKAAGIEWDANESPFTALRLQEEDDDTGCVWWNPLTDDGDALRLAVACGILINVTKTNIIVRCGDFYGVANRNTLRVHKADEVEFLRRAIVRAAAAIGSAK
jgi:hypothetical protein